jgi:hypothetical protein
MSVRLQDDDKTFSAMTPANARSTPPACKAKEKLKNHAQGTAPRAAVASG